MVTALPVIDVGPLFTGDAAHAAVGADIDAACREFGFFCITGHGVDPALAARLIDCSHEFFALDVAEKSKIAMRDGGRAWRGWFPLGGELTSGAPDGKEGIYFGEEVAADDPRVRNGRWLCGPNLFPERPAAMRATVLEWIAVMTRLGHCLMACMATGLGLDPNWFARELTGDPVTLFRIFLYPGPSTPALTAPTPGTLNARVDGPWGVAEHTDYGLLTILMQDDCGGLQVKSRGTWIDVPADPEVLVCNLGDMLDRMTGGRYLSTPHRVRNTAGRNRLSFPFFFDPGWDSEVQPLPLGGDAGVGRDASERWDGTSLEELTGTYGDYLSAKVAKVFPQLVQEPPLA
jgi:isopenicillin N synthase-like dioxygenase